MRNDMVHEKTHNSYETNRFDGKIWASKINGELWIAQDEADNEKTGMDDVKKWTDQHEKRNF